MGFTAKKVEKLGIGSTARTMAGAGPTDLLYMILRSSRMTLIPPQKMRR